MERRDGRTDAYLLALAGQVQLTPLHLVGVRNDAADKRRTRAGHTGEPRRDHPSGARLGGREAQAARARELENELLDPSFVAGEQPLLEPLGERLLERFGSLLRLGLGQKID